MNAHIIAYTLLSGIIVTGAVLSKNAIENANQATYRQAVISSELILKLGETQALLRNSESAKEELQKQLDKTPEKVKFSWELSYMGERRLFTFKFVNARTGEVIRTEREWFW